MNTGRTWANAPSGVRDARQLAILGVFFSGLFVFIILMRLASAGFARVPLSFTIIEGALFLPFYIWLLAGLKRGTKAAYYVQALISVFGLALWPLGTLINAYILFKWFRPETRAWFAA